ncbi:sensor histidine kinase KdpD [Dehalobacter sp. DCM]|uniref:sensor histidine kinase n=1 Tax=Dehalobacter sp. DCM TaxID=2907827 RepID=UPI0030815BA8|nr:sensor histidine kinase KdpD [Dehalobacter sp. DCM]
MEPLTESTKYTGKLKIFLGYAKGVGKTYAMLDDAKSQFSRGVDVVVGYLEPHTPPETIHLMEQIPSLSPIILDGNNQSSSEFDLDTALIRRPDLILVDELAHVNADGMRNKKRYLDIEELLKAGIDVYTTLNVQNIESLRDIIQNITNQVVDESIPDYIFANADKVELVDAAPDKLQKYYLHQEDTLTVEQLQLLRELALRTAADRISHSNDTAESSPDKKAGIKLLVCLSSSPSSAKSIRWTARTAEVFHAPWTALYVENMENRHGHDSEKETLQANLDLAEQLGAKIVILNGYDIPSVITEYAKLSGITNVVIGKSRNNKPLKNLLDIRLEDKLIAMMPGIEIHIIPGVEATKPSLPFHQPRKIHFIKDLFLTWSDTFKTLVILAGATLLSLGMQYIGFNSRDIMMVYLLSVFLISRITMGYVYGGAASVITVILFNYFFIVPVYSIHAFQAGYPITFIVMLIVALITSTSTIRIKSQAQLAVQRESRTELLYEINKKLLVTRGLDNIIILTNDALSVVFGCSVIFYAQDPQSGSPGYLHLAATESDASYMLSENERAVAHWVFVNQKPAGAGTDTHKEAKAYYIPIAGQSDVLGVIGLTSVKEKLTRDQRELLKMIASHVALALERQKLSDEQRTILIEAEKEKMRSNLLRAISHDLRTPLTGILGASSVILESSESLDKPTQHQLLVNIKEDSQWLIRMVENLLSVTRIKEGTMNVAMTDEAAEEIVAEAVSRTRKRYPHRKISVQVPDTLLIVPMDGTLILQVLLNLLENAIRHTPDNSTVEILVSQDRNDAVFEVSDYGTGINGEDFPYLFESYIPNGKRSSDSARGMGIGLSICMSIIKAHNGMIDAYNKDHGGAVFWFTLPLKQEDHNEQ